MSKIEIENSKLHFVPRLLSQASEIEKKMEFPFSILEISVWIEAVHAFLEGGGVSKFVHFTFSSFQ
jgi:hypothetical protein